MKVLKVDKEKLREALYGRRTEVAEIMGIHPESLSRKLRSEDRLSLDDLNQIAVALDRDASEFILLVDVSTTEHSVLEFHQNTPVDGKLQAVENPQKNRALERMLRRLGEPPEEHQVTWNELQKGLKEAPFSLREIHLKESSE